MEFRFSLNDLFKSDVVEIDCNLLPPEFEGDKRAFWEAIRKVSEIVNAVGEASAVAQGLARSITTVERLRNSNHSIYLLVDRNVNRGKGAILGMLKVGVKNLYVFNRDGENYQVSPLCILDFFIHESRQRTGLGKRLFEYMLQVKNIEAGDIAIDRPSLKFLSFLSKHYSLTDPINQMTNYVVFDNFFIKLKSPEKTEHSIQRRSSYLSPTNSYESPVTSPCYGRYGAPRPACTLGQIIHNQSPTTAQNSPVGLGGNNSHQNILQAIASDEVETEVRNGREHLFLPLNDKAMPTNGTKLTESELNANFLESRQEKETSLKSSTSEGKQFAENSSICISNVNNNGYNETLNITAGDVEKKLESPGYTAKGYFDLKFFHNKLW